MNIAIFASGRGSNFQAILNAIQDHLLSARICVVVSNNSSAGALEIARNNNIPTFHLSSTQFPSEEAFVENLSRVLDDHKADFIALAGYMKKLPPAFVRRFRHRIANVHPALLPAFGGQGMFGMRVHAAVIASGCKVSGATVHLVDEEYDRGPIVVQKTVAVTHDDTPESLAAKVLAVEHEIFPLALSAFAQGKVRIEEQKAWIQQS
jgi:phosphoribosylglycinamide formyltransferase-1